MPATLLATHHQPPLTPLDRAGEESHCTGPWAVVPKRLTVPAALPGGGVEGRSTPSKTRVIKIKQAPVKGSEEQKVTDTNAHVHPCSPY